METEFTIGEKVKVAALPPYIKTAEPMPMLRPPNVVRLGEEGIVIDRRPGGYWAVRLSRGAFLMESQYLESVSPPGVEHGGFVPPIQVADQSKS